MREKERREQEEAKGRVLKDLLGRVRKRERGVGWVSERWLAAKHSRSVDGKRTTIWSTVFNLNTPLL